jgi:hypothetical protein
MADDEVSNLTLIYCSIKLLLTRHFDFRVLLPASWSWKPAAATNHT